MHGFILNGDLSPVLLQNKLRKTPLNAAINLFTGLLCLCAIFMHQSIPAAPIPPPRATAGHLRALSVLGVGH